MISFGKIKTIFIYITCLFGTGFAAFLLFSPQYIAAYSLLFYANSQRPIGTISKQEQQAHKKSENLFVWLPVNTDSLVYPGDWISTGENALTTINLASGDLEIGPNSLIHLKSLSNSDFIDIERGNIEIKLQARKKLYLSESGITRTIKNTQDKKTLVIKSQSTKQNPHLSGATKYIMAPENNSFIWLDLKDQLRLAIKNYDNEKLKITIDKKDNRKPILIRNSEKSVTYRFRSISPGSYVAKVKRNKRLVDSSNFIVSRSSQPAPLKPVASSEILSQQKEIQFNWSNIPGTDEYLFQVSDDQEFTNLIIEEVTSEPISIQQNHLIPDQYFWRVRILSGESPDRSWSQAWSFSIKAEKSEKLTEQPKPDQFDFDNFVFFPKPKITLERKIADPRNLGKTKINYILNWQKPEGIDPTFLVEVFNDTNKEQPFIKLETTKSSVEVPLHVKDKLTAKIYIKRNDDQSWLQTKRGLASIRLKEILRLPKPNLIQPTENAKIFALATEQENEVILGWQHTLKKINFEIQVAEDNDFKKIILEKSTSKERQLIKLKRQKKQYYWRVRATHPKAKSPWTKPRSFRVN